MATSHQAQQAPHEFEAEVEIARAASEVYALLDFADPLNAKRQLGDKVTEAAGEPGRFDLVITELPDAVFSCTVTAAERDREYAYSCVSTPTFGLVTRSHELYRLEALGPSSCRLTLVNTVEFDGELREDDLSIETMLLAMSSISALEKIKLHAEEGVEAVRELTAAQMAAMDAFDCGDD